MARQSERPGPDKASRIHALHVVVSEREGGGGGGVRVRVCVFVFSAPSDCVCVEQAKRLTERDLPKEDSEREWKHTWIQQTQQRSG